MQNSPLVHINRLQDISYHQRSYAIKKAKIFDGEQILNNKVLIIEGNIIKEIVEENIWEAPKNCEIIHMDDLTISAGFIDLQLNGCGGWLFNDNIELKCLEMMHQTNLKFGCTSFLPTLITTSEANIIKAVKVATDFYQAHPFTILGLHVEGPYINSEKKGIHNINYIKSINQDMVSFFTKAVENIPLMITMAPECNDLVYIEQLTKRGVQVALGHSNATYEEARAGIKAGITCATHLFNAMSNFQGRSPGVVGAVLNSEIFAGIIIDGYHVSYESVAIVKKIKQDKLYIVTDAVTPMGTNMTTFKLSDQEIYVKGGKCVNADNILAGSNIDMMSSIKNAVNYAWLSLEESLRMATWYPATVMGINNYLGKVAPNYIANLTAFDCNYKVKHTIDRGKLINF
ncbi:N-acetylglucosamine-6-phosphate deacetylase [Candidatus Hepatincolaceae symbiont of Richtersius coronifer]